MQRKILTSVAAVLEFASRPLRDALYAVMWFRADYRRDREYLAAQAWYQSYVAGAGSREDFAIALRRGEQTWDELVRIEEHLDRKAEWTFLVASSGAGLSLAHGFGWPALALFCAALLAALRTRIPGGRPIPMSGRGVLEFVAAGYVVEANLAAALNSATIGLRVVTLWKARTTRGAGWWLLAAAIAAGIGRYSAAP